MHLKIQPLSTSLLVIFAGGSSCSQCMTCDATNGIQKSACTATSNTQCTCNAGFYSTNYGQTCSPCSSCLTNAQVAVPCSPSANTQCECNVGYFTPSSGEACRPCTVCSSPMMIESVSCTGSTDTVCTCGPNYWSVVPGATAGCNPCTSCVAPEVETSPCTGTANAQCGIVVSCTKSDGSVSECVTPETCYSCNENQQSTSSTTGSVGISGSSGASSGSVSGSAESTAQQSSTANVGFCCNVATTDCASQCTVPKSQKAISTASTKCHNYLVMLLILGSFVYVKGFLM